MTKQKELSKKKMAVIDDLFASQFDEQMVLKKHKVSRAIYNKWLGSENFIEEMDRRIAWLNRQSQAVIAKYATLAAAKLVELTDSEKEETARKACLDIISLPKPTVKNAERAETAQTPLENNEQLTAATASKLLAVLAEEQTPPADNDQTAATSESGS